MCNIMFIRCLLHCKKKSKGYVSREMNFAYLLNFMDLDLDCLIKIKAVFLFVCFDLCFLFVLFFVCFLL